MPALAQRSVSDEVWTELGALARSKPFWTPKELAEMLCCSISTVVRHFEDEPGTLDLNTRSPRRGKKPHQTLRIPGSLLERKFRDLGFRRHFRRGE